MEKSAPTRLRLFLRDHRVLDADVRIPQGQTLATYLASRNRYVNLTGVDWVGTGSTVQHMALKVTTILWASSHVGDLLLTTALGSGPARRVRLELTGGYLLSAGLLLVRNQRLSDYLQAAPAFVPLRDAELLPRHTSLGDIVVNQEAIQAVREELPGGPRAEPTDPTGFEDAAATGTSTGT
jgi:hypothetical protein